MTVQELQDLLAQAVEALNQNRQMATPQFLDVVRKGVAFLRANPAVQSIIALEINTSTEAITNSLASVDKALQVEDMVLAGNTTDNAVRVAQALHDHWFICQMIAPFIK